MRILSILVFCLITGLTGCQIDADANRSTAAQTPLPEDVISDAASANEKHKTEEGKQAARPSPLDQVFELQSGIYGVPFGATTDELMKWCTDNHMAVANPTEDQVKEDARRAVRRIKDLEEAYDFEKTFLTPLEQELLKLAHDYADTGDVFELAKVAAAQEKLDVLKNPTISYEGQKYHLAQVHKGMQVYVDNEQKVCNDERIAKTAYRLTLTPTVKSENMIAAGLEMLEVFLYAEIGEEPRAYAGLAFFGASPDRSMDVQFDLVTKSLSEKYGTPDLNPRSQQGCPSIVHDVKNILGSEFEELLFVDRIVWARNVLLLASVKQVSSRQVELSHRATGFAVLYYDRNAAMGLFKLHARAMEDFEKQYCEDKKQALARMQQDF